MGRALSEGKAPTIPALHWAITSAGCEMMNSGAPTAGSRSLSLSTFGSAIEVPDPPNRSHINRTRRHGQGHLRDALTPARSARRKHIFRLHHDRASLRATAAALAPHRSACAAD